LNETELHNLMLNVEKSESKIKKSQTKNGLKLTVILKTNAYTGTKSKKIKWYRTSQLKKLIVRKIGVEIKKSQTEKWS